MLVRSGDGGEDDDEDNKLFLALKSGRARSATLMVLGITLFVGIRASRGVMEKARMKEEKLPSKRRGTSSLIADKKQARGCKLV